MALEIRGTGCGCSGVALRVIVNILVLTDSKYCLEVFQWSLQIVLFPVTELVTEFMVCNLISKHMYVLDLKSTVQTVTISIQASSVF